MHTQLLRWCGKFYHSCIQSFFTIKTIKKHRNWLSPERCPRAKPWENAPIEAPRQMHPVLIPLHTQTICLSWTPQDKHTLANPKRLPVRTNFRGYGPAVVPSVLSGTTPCLKRKSSYDVELQDRNLDSRVPPPRSKLWKLGLETSRDQDSSLENQSINQST